MMGAISTFVTYFVVFETMGIAIGAGISVYFRNPQDVF